MGPAIQIPSARVAILPELRGEVTNAERWRGC
jgi:hypothetical protein